MSEERQLSDDIQDAASAVQSANNLKNNFAPNHNPSKKSKGTDEKAKGSSKPDDLKSDGQGSPTADKAGEVSSTQPAGNKVAAGGTSQETKLAQKKKSIADDPKAFIKFLHAVREIFKVVLIFLIIAFILLLGYNILHALGLDQVSQRTDFLYYVDNACGIVESNEEEPSENETTLANENKKESLEDACSNADVSTAVDNLSDQEILDRMMMYGPDETIKAFTILTVDACADELRRITDLFIRTKKEFDHDFDIYFDDLDTTTPYYRGWVTGPMGFIFPSAHLGEFDHEPSESEVLFGTPLNTKEIQSGDFKFNGGTVLTDALDGMYFTPQQMGYLIAAHQVATGDTVPVQSGDMETGSEGSGPSNLDDIQVSSFKNFMDMLTSTAGVMYDYDIKTEDEEVLLRLSVSTLSVKEDPGVAAVSCSNFGIYTPSDIVCTVDENGNHDGGMTSIDNTVTTYEVVASTPVAEEYTAKKIVLYETLNELDNYLIADFALAHSRYFDYGTGERHFFYIDDDLKNSAGVELPKIPTSEFLETLNKDFSTVHLVTRESDYVLSPYDVCAYKHQGVDDFFEGVFRKWTAPKNVNTTAEADVEYHECIDFFRSSYQQFAVPIREEYFYRYAPVYYHDCDHEPTTGNECQHDNGDGTLCGAELRKEFNFIMTSRRENTNYLGSLLNGEELFRLSVKWTSNIRKTAERIQKFFTAKSDAEVNTGSEQNLGNYIWDNCLKFFGDFYHAMTTGVTFTLEKLETTDPDTGETIPVMESYTSEELSDDLSSSETKKHIFTVEEKIEGYLEDISEAFDLDGLLPYLKIHDDVYNPDDDSKWGSHLEHETVSDISGVMPNCIITPGKTDCAIYSNYGEIAKPIWNRVHALLANGTITGARYNCTAFANYMLHEIYGLSLANCDMFGHGVDKAKRVSTSEPFERLLSFPNQASIEANWSQIKPGSIFSYNNAYTRRGGGVYGHVVFVNDVDYAKGTITISDGNYAGGIRVLHEYPIVEFIKGSCNGGTRCEFAIPKDSATFRTDPRTFRP